MEIPRGWTRRFSERRNLPYYYNVATGESVWGEEFELRLLVVAETEQPVPAHVNFLLDPSTPLKLHITVGQPDASERFGVNKWMLIARSSVFRKMLWESNPEHIKEFTITDVEPTTFKHLLTFLYGHDNTGSLAFQDSVELLCVAEKYDVADLKARLGRVLQVQVSPHNLFFILGHAQVCETLPDLWQKITDVIQYQTAAVFSHPEFISVSPEVVMHILQQDRLSVPEIQVWRAALEWAKAKEQPPVDIVPPENLRNTLLPFLKLIRLCTLSAKEFSEEVVTTRILSGVEVTEITISLVTKQKSDKLQFVSNDIEKREKVPSVLRRLTDSKRCSLSVATPLIGPDISLFYMNTSYRLCTKNSKIELLGVKSRTSFHPYSTGDSPLGLTFNCKFQIAISKLNWVGSAIAVRINVVADIPFEREIEDDTEIFIPFQNHSRGVDVVLEPNTEYLIEYISSDHTRSLRFWETHSPVDCICNNDDLYLSFLSRNGNDRYMYNLTDLYYKPLEE